MMNIKTIAIPAFIALSLVFTACAKEQTIEAPGTVDGAAQDGMESVEQGADDAGNAAQDGMESVEQGADDAGNAVQDGAKNFQKGAEDAGSAAQDGVKQGVEGTGDAMKDMGDKIPDSKSE
jgi:hypothetical protein